jgi:H+/Cl- antiporter ClcA
MLRRLTEGTVLFISVLKWVLLSAIVGIIVGLSTTLFLKILEWSIDFTRVYSYYYYFLPVALFLSIIIIDHLAPEAEGHGTEKVIEAVHKKSGKIKAMVVPVKLVATIITVALGGSVGKEGPCAQIGGGLASMMADLLKFNNADRKKIVICGISAGFASVFGTPIAGAVFGVEVLFIGSIMYDVLLPSFIAGMISYHVSSAFGIQYLYHPIKFVPVFSELFMVKIVIAGIFFGLCSFFMVESLNFGEKISQKIKVWKPLKGLIGGAIIIVLAKIFSTQYLGLGITGIESALKGAEIVWYAFIMKYVFTSLTLNFGGSGGIVTPIFFVGAAAGSVFARVLGLDMATYAAIGVVSLLAGAANTPIAASIMAVEFFGPAIAPYAAISCVISFLITGHRSVYPSQVVAFAKSPSLIVDIGKEVEEVDGTIRAANRGWIRTVFKIVKRFEEIRDRNIDKDDKE